MQKHPEKEKGTFMEKSTLKKIVGAVRELELKKSRNDSQFEFYDKKRRRIEREGREISKSGSKKAVEYYKQNKETLNFCYSFMGKIENENKVINNQIKQYLINYILITFVEKLNKLKTFNYKKLDKIINEISTVTNKIHNFKNYNHNVLCKNCDYTNSIDLCIDYNDNINVINDCTKYFEKHLAKKTIIKKFAIDDFKEFINWDIKTLEQEVQDNNTTEAKLNEFKSKIEKLINDYNQERKKLTINQENYKYIYIMQN